MTHFHSKRGVPLYIVDRRPRKRTNPDAVAMAVSGAILIVFIVYGFLEVLQ